MQSVVFFNNKGGVGKTTLLYHCAFALADLGTNVAVIDLDPQANLTSFFYTDDMIEELWNGEGSSEATVYTALAPLLRGKGGLERVKARKIEGESGVRFLPGDMRLADIEDELSTLWPACLNEGLGQERALVVTAAFHQMLQELSRQHRTEIVLIDVGPNFGAINRSALIAADFVVVPLGADLFSIKGLRNLGPRLESWRNQWKQRLAAAPDAIRPLLPGGSMAPLGFTINMFNVSRGLPAAAFQRWIQKAPDAFAETFGRRAEDDKLGEIQNYHSQMPIAQENRRPIFRVNKQADYLAVGDHFKALATRILGRMERLSACS